MLPVTCFVSVVYSLDERSEREQGRCTVEELFSGGTRTFANKHSLCGCDLRDQPLHEGCEKCDPSMSSFLPR